MNINKFHNIYNMKTNSILLITTILLSSCAQSNKSEMDVFVGNLMSKMTLEEKIGQLNLPVAQGTIITGETRKEEDTVAKLIKGGMAGGIFNMKGVDNIRETQRMAVEESRLGIPLLFGMDVIHGYETIFPLPLGLACTWDMEAIESSARIASIESTADGLNWTFSPMVDICRDPRWGRMAEGAGEDPFLGAAISRAMIRGYQGESLADPTTIMACVKHFALYGGAEAGRDYNTVDMSRQSMYNYYLEPYKAAAEEGAGSYMSSFNVVDGIPASGNRWLLTDLLRNQWKFDGFVVSDYGAIMEMSAHGLGDLQQVSSLALKAGMDMDMMGDGFIGTLRKSYEEGKVTEADIDQACRRILEAKYKLGLFADPYLYCDSERAKTQVYTPEHRAVAREIAAESFVLLKNENNLLPLKKSGTIALVGPMADTRTNIYGVWAGTADAKKYKSLREAMVGYLGNDAKVLYAKGCNFCYDEEMEANHAGWLPIRDGRTDAQLHAEALAIARKADVIVYAGNELANTSGEASSRADLTLPDTQLDLLKELKNLGKPIVMLNFTGRSTIMNWENENIPAILNVWFGGSEAGDAICDVIFGDKCPSGKLVTSIPKCMGQIPLYYNHLPTGRPQEEWFTKFRSAYQDIDNEPLYPFGYGLSYTTFEYSDVALDAATMHAGGSIKATVKVTNTGTRDADEIVQMYINDPVASISRPVKELKGFERISLKAGESKTVEFVITEDLLKFYNSNLELVSEPGEFVVMIGPNSKDVTSQKFVLQ